MCFMPLLSRTLVLSIPEERQVIGDLLLEHGVHLESNTSTTARHDIYSRGVPQSRPE